MTTMDPKNIQSLPIGQVSSQDDFTEPGRARSVSIINISALNQSPRSSAHKNNPSALHSVFGSDPRFAKAVGATQPQAGQTTGTPAGKSKLTQEEPKKVQEAPPKDQEGADKGAQGLLDTARAWSEEQDIDFEKLKKKGNPSEIPKAQERFIGTLKSKEKFLEQLGKQLDTQFKNTDGLTRLKKELKEFQKELKEIRSNAKQDYVLAEFLYRSVQNRFLSYIASLQNKLQSK